MRIPDWWTTFLLAVAAWRSFQLLAYDDVLAWPRRYITWGLLTCPYCAGWWIGLAWFGAWQLWAQGTLVAAVPFVLSAAVVAGDKLLGSE